MIKAKEKPPYAPARYPIPAPPPIKTGTPIAPSKSHTSTIRKDCDNGNTSAIMVTTKLSAVIWEPFGRGILIYADAQSTAANNAMMTKDFVLKSFSFIMFSFR